MFRKRQKAASFAGGFTLVELLVVMAIISVLIGILLPALNRARANSRRTVCRSNLHQAGLAFRAYLDDASDIMPMAAQMPSTEPGMPSITQVLKPYHQNSKIFQCPADTQTADYGKTYFDTEGTSYEYPLMLRGKRVATLVSEMHQNETAVFVLFDFTAFHGPAGDLGSSNYLFADWHVGDLE